MSCNLQPLIASSSEGHKVFQKFSSQVPHCHQGYPGSIRWMELFGWPYLWLGGDRECSWWLANNFWPAY